MLYYSIIHCNVQHYASLCYTIRSLEILYVTMLCSFVSCFSPAVAKSIIGLHEGAIAVTSEGLGAGCTFTVEIPVYSISEATVVKRASNALSAALRRSSPFSCMLTDRIGYSRKSMIKVAPNDMTSMRSNINLLVVDDSSLNRKMLCRLLKDQVKSITEAADGLEAVSYMKCADKSMIDVILMDYIMPNMDGPTATREIRALGYNGVIIGLTGNAYPEDIESFINAGANRVLTKPVQIAELFSVIEGTDDVMDIAFIV